METIKDYKGYLIILIIYIFLNSWIFIKWITEEFDSDFVGGIERTFLLSSNMLINVVFLIGFLMVGFKKKERRKLYLTTSLLAIISIGMLILTRQ